jgi:hypothetical protein
VHSYASGPVYYRQVSPPPSRGDQAASASYQQATSPQRPSTAAPQYTGSIRQPPDAAQSPPQRSFFQLGL